MTRVAPAKVRKEAKLGLMLHKKWKRGGTAVGVARAVQLSSGKAVSDATIKRMYSYFQRHQHDRLDKDGSDGSIPGRGYIAWLLWGGYSGRKWAESEYKKLKKEKNPITKPVKKIKEDLAKKTVYLMKVSLDDFRSEPWAQDMVTKEEDFEVVDNYDDNGEPIFKTSEYVLSVVPKKYLQDFEFLRHMQMEGKLEKHSFSSAARAWLENDQPLDWFNEQAHDRGYLTKDEYLFLVKVNNPTIQERVKQKKEYFIELAKECKLKPVFNTKDGRLLSNYLMSDKKFKEKMKELCPQWFENDKGPRKQTIYSMEKIREIAKSGEKRPSNTSKNLEEKKLGIIISNLFAIYPDFRNEIFSLRPDWFRSEERKMFAEYKEENPYKMSNPARNVANVEDVKKFCERALEEFDEQLGYNADADRYLQTNIMQWFRSNFFKGIMNSERTQDYFIDLNEDNYQEIYFEHTGNYEWPDFVEKSIREGKKIEFFYPRVREGYFPSFSIEHFADFFNSGDFPANPSRVSYDQMIGLVLQWDEKNKKKEMQELVEGDEKVFIEYPNGVKWVQMFSRKALENEGAKMGGICIGSASNHVEPIKKGDHQAFSLRDEYDDSYITVEYIVNDAGYGEANTVREVKGYNNEKINTLKIDDDNETGGNEKYVKDLFLKLPNHNIEGSFYSNNYDFQFKNIELLYANGKIFTIEEFENYDGDELYVNGDLDLSYTKIKTLPKKLTVSGNLNLTDSSISHIEGDIIVGENFSLYDCNKLTYLSGNFAIGGKLNLKYCELLTNLPEKLKVGADLNLSYCKSLKFLPEGLRCGGSVHLDYCVSLAPISENLKDFLSIRRDIENLEKFSNPTKKLYLFSYGSNNPDQLAERLERKVKTKGAYAEDMARIFVGHSRKWNGAVASIERQEGKKVYGLVAEVTEADLKKMDVFEGVASGKYKRKKIKVTLQSGEEVSAIAYIASDSTRGRPSREYLEAVAKTISAHWKGSRGEDVKVSDIKTNNPLEIIARGIDERPASAYDREELKLGLKTELEHTDDAIIASKIAKDHLDEHPHYYSKLVEMERGMKKSNPIIERIKKIILKEKNPKTETSFLNREDELLSSSLIIKYCVLSSLKAAGDAGLPVVLIAKAVMMMVIKDPKNYPENRLKIIQRNAALMVSRILEKLDEESINGKDYVFKRPARKQPKGTAYEDMAKQSHVVYVIDPDGVEYLNELEEQIKRAINRVEKTKNVEDLKSLLNLSKSVKEEDFTEPSGEEEKKANPVTPASEEYLPIVQDSIKDKIKGLEAWIDEVSGDILVGWMAFEEDRSFDDVLIRIKTSGRILEGESVDDSIRKYVHGLMKNIHKELVSYITNKKSNPTDKSDILNEKELLSNDFYYSLTRIGILFICKNSSEPLDASIIAKSINELLGKKIALSAVYRELHVLMDKKLVIELGKRKSKSDSSAKTRIIAHYNISPKGKIALNESIQKLGNLIKSLSSEKKTNPTHQISSDKLSIIKSFYSKVSKNSEPSGEEEKKSNPVPAGVDPKEFDSLVEKLKKRKDVDNPYALANWILKQKNPTAYEKLVKQLAAKGVDDPKALAAWIGRQKYGKEEFQRRAAAGRRRKKNPITSANEIDAIKEELNDILRSEKNV